MSVYRIQYRRNSDPPGHWRNAVNPDPLLYTNLKQAVSDAKFFDENGSDVHRVIELLPSIQRWP